MSHDAREALERGTIKPAGQQVIRIRIKLTKAQAHRLGRMARWEKASAGTVLTLGPAALAKLPKLTAEEV